LEAAHGSLFDYCVRQLQMSEDEACRRIDLARLARRFPALFPLLASGEITLSSALALKPVLTTENHLELLTAARHKSIQQTRELVAARFPSPDVPTTLRKLPESKPAPTPARSEAAAPLFAAPSQPAPSSAGIEAPAPAPLSVHASRPGPAQHRIEPIAAQRYKLQLTIDAATKSQLETARDLLRHAEPSGDLARVLSRALELLIADLLRRRFGVGKRRNAAGERAPEKTPQASVSKAGTPPPTSADASVSEAGTPPPASPGAASAHIPHANRRAVIERDGLACTWVDANGNRCSSRAWLELDHRHPRGKGGSSEAENIRVLCRAHNQLAAERAYGRAHIERAKTRRRALERSGSTDPSASSTTAYQPMAR
ncbi:MAG TPA: hypothetical protein VFS67_00255, partial [Polyangiaceae bacterium]|nr:hypothetical protein [Polyangiaceae bacterium]